MKSTIKTGDMVKILAGDNKGKTAKVVKVSPKENKAFLEGIEVRERHLRATQFNPKGGKKTVHLGIDLSNLKKEEGKK
ncbi:50S ribosomal protein L24 [Candidatus Saccharibacteria bacterium]|nr:50S ribosomal protein L24 [Candidatus Saccharibacteria bacterium]MBQ6147598.1 50S ribosomal protein L24 [Candidatus Saccharibacteria bacterium]MBQ6605656.1 50S ribosomal protein L24 [Candidatus Saccharibacteria bacterium]